MYVRVRHQTRAGIPRTVYLPYRVAVFSCCLEFAKSSRWKLAENSRSRKLVENRQVGQSSTSIHIAICLRRAVPSLRYKRISIWARDAACVHEAQRVRQRATSRCGRDTQWHTGERAPSASARRALPRERARARHRRTRATLPHTQGDQSLPEYCHHGIHVPRVPHIVRIRLNGIQGLCPARVHMHVPRTACPPNGRG